MKQYSGKALAKRFDQEMRATGLGLFGLEGISNKRVYAARKVLDEETFLEFVYYSVIARMACGAMSVNDIQFLDAARANGDTEHRFMWKDAPAEVERLRELVPLYPAWKVTELMQARRASRVPATRQPRREARAHA